MKEDKSNITMICKNFVVVISLTKRQKIILNSC